MLNKLRQNYRLGNTLIRLAFVLLYVFYSWQDSLASAQLAAQQIVTYAVSDAFIVAMGLLSSLVLGIVLMFAVPYLMSWFLHVCRFYNIPRSEFGLLAQLFCCIYYLACGLLRLLNLATPLLLNWGGVLFPFVVSLCCVIGFYHVTSQLYFNDVTRPYYFRSVAIVYFVCAVVFEVLL